MTCLLNSLILLRSSSHKIRNVAGYFNFNSGFNNTSLLRITNMSQVCSSNLHFKGKADRYNGFIVDSQEESVMNMSEFCRKLDDSLTIWTKNELRGIWFKVHLNQSDWVPVLAKNGFKCHHAKEDYIMMYKWLPKTENCNIPYFAHTMVGVGAVVVNDNKEVLIVQEKYHITNKPHYKLPGGYVEPGENLVDAAIREVHEETNIRTEFQSVLTLRHTHKTAYNCSDIYIVVQLKANTSTIKKCDRELLEAKWISIQEFLDHPNITNLNKFMIKKYLEYKEHGIKINCYHGMHELLDRPYTMYSVTNNDDDSCERSLDIVKK